MSRIFIAAFTAFVVIGTWGAAQACEPGGSFGAKRGGAPFFTAAPAGFGTFSAFEGQKQLLAQQAAAYRAQRQPLRFAKAMQAREKTLADRAERRALIAQKYQEYRRRKGLDGPIPSDAPQLAKMGDAISR